jgi:hypothetical protein
MKDQEMRIQIQSIAINMLLNIRRTIHDSE